MNSLFIEFIKDATESDVLAALNHDYEYDLVIASSSIIGNDGNIRYYIYGEYYTLISSGLINSIDTGRRFYNGEFVYCAYINLFDLFSTKDDGTIHSDIEKAILFNM